jgi:hypothetical protein
LSLDYFLTINLLFLLIGIQHLSLNSLRVNLGKIPLHLSLSLLSFGKRLKSSLNHLIFVHVLLFLPLNFWCSDLAVML